MCFLRADPGTSVAKEDICRFEGAVGCQNKTKEVHLCWVGGADTLTGTSLSVNVAAQASQMRTV